LRLYRYLTIHNQTSRSPLLLSAVEVTSCASSGRREGEKNIPLGIYFGCIRSRQ